MLEWSDTLTSFQTAERVLGSDEPLSQKLDSLTAILRERVGQGHCILLLEKTHGEKLSLDAVKDETHVLLVSSEDMNDFSEFKVLSGREAAFFLSKIGISKDIEAHYCAVAPLISGSTALGVLCLCRERPFSDKEMAEFSLFSDQIANALHSEILKTSIVSLDRIEGEGPQILREYYETVIHTVEDMIFILNAEGKFVFTNKRAKEIMGESIIGKHFGDFLVPEHKELVKKEFKKRLSGTISSPYKIQVFDKDGEKRWLEISGVPLLREGKVVGACGNARDVTEKIQLDRQRQHLTSIANDILQRKNLSEIMDTVVRAIHDHCGFGRVIISLLDETLEATDLAFAGLTEEEQKRALKRHLSAEQRRSILSERFRVGQSYYIPHDQTPWDTLGVESKLKPEQMKNWHPDDFLFIPLHGENKRVIGLISVDDPTDGKAPTPESLAPVELFATQAAIAIENAKLYKKIREHAALLESRVEERTQKSRAFLETTYRLRETTSWEKGMKIILEGITKAFGFENAELFLKNEARGVLENIATIGTEKKDSIPLNDMEYVAAQCVAKGKPMNIKHASTDERVKKQIEPVMESFAWIPIMTQNEVVGAISVYNLTSRNPILDEDVDDLLLFASQAAHFVETTRRLISPAVEKTLTTEMKYRIAPGESYLIESTKISEAFEIFVDAVTHGIQGFSICRRHPKKVRKEYGLQKTPILWLSTIETEESVDPKDLAKINHMFNEFLKRATDSVLLLEGIEYLVIQNSFEKVVKALHSLNDYVIISNSRLLLPVNPRTLSEKELSLLEKEFQVLKK